VAVVVVREWAGWLAGCWRLSPARVVRRIGWMDDDDWRCDCGWCGGRRDGKTNRQHTRLGVSAI
jgi:hypothetical protein